MKHKKLLSLILASGILYSNSYGIGYMPMFISTKQAVQAQASHNLEISEKLVSMTDEDTIKVKATFNSQVTRDTLNISFGDQLISEWKTWNSETLDYTGEDFITYDNMVIVTSYVGDTITSTVEFDLNFGYLYNTSDVSPRSIRVKYPELIGEYALTLENTAAKEAYSTQMTLNVYDSFRPFETIKPEIDEIIENAPASMYVAYDVAGQSVEGRDHHMVIIAKDKESVDTYLNETVPLMLENPEAIQEAITNGTNEHKVAIFVNNIHPDETPGISSQLDFLQAITTDDVITFESLDEEGLPVTKSLSISEALEDIVLVMSITENPDGSVYNTRTNANGFDLNRDNGYQTQIETQNIVSQIVKWTPLSFIDLHGFVNSFLIEPCTPPHDQNNEYDLLLENQIEQAKAMGNAGISNTMYESYEIPVIDDYYRHEDGSWADVWDDGTIAYTATYAQSHGSLGHTLEIPDLNQASNDAALYALFGAVDYVTENKDKLFMNQLEYYKRGIEGIDHLAVDDYIVNAQNESIGRDRGENENFFPEYYVLPVGEGQKNTAAVYEMVEYLLRNGVKVHTLTKETTLEETTYTEGAYVVDMHQARRGFANAVLYGGFNASDFPSIYAEIVVNFPALRGFDLEEVRIPSVFDNKLEEVVEAPVKRTETPETSKYYVLKNSSLDAVKAVDTLLANNEEVHIFTEEGSNQEEGDFLIAQDSLGLVLDDYCLELVPHNGRGNKETLTQPKVYVDSTYATYIANELGFETTDALAEATIIIDEYGTTEIEAITNGVDFLGIGDDPLVKLGQQLIPGIEVNETISYKEGLLLASYEESHMLTSGYDDEIYAYSTSGAWIENVPSGVTTLLEISDQDDFYVGGWWPASEEAKGKTLGVTTTEGDSIITFYANNFTSRAHNENSFRLMSNAIYQSVLPVE